MSGVSVGQITKEYDNLINNLQGQYQLAETDAEKERLRYVLSDIEAQYNAGRDSIAQTYEQRIQNIQNLSAQSAPQYEQRAVAAGESLRSTADDLQRRLAEQYEGVANQYSGLGVGAANVPSSNEYVDFLRSFAPVQQQYMQNLGNISTEGMDWLAQSGGLEQNAQQSELMRLRAATQSGVQYQYQREVADRIQREREQLRENELQLQLRKIAAVQAAREFNAQMAASAASRTGTSVAQEREIDNLIALAVQQNFSKTTFEKSFTSRTGFSPRPEDYARYWGYMAEGSRDRTSTTQERIQTLAMQATEAYSKLGPTSSLYLNLDKQIDNLTAQMKTHQSNTMLYDALSRDAYTNPNQTPWSR